MKYGATGAWCVIVMALAAAPASAQPLADRVPQDALFYVGWAGAQHLPAGYAGSHLKGLLEASDAAKVLDEALPRLLARIGADGPRGDHAAAAMAALAGPAWRHPSALYWGGLDVVGDIPAPKMAIIVDAGDEGKALAEALRALVGRIPQQAMARVEEEGGLVVFAMGPAEVSAKKKPVVPLAQRKEFRKAMDGLVKEPAAAIYLDSEGMSEQIDQLILAFAPGDVKDRWAVIKDALGVGNFKRFAWAGGFEDKMWAGATFVESPEPRAAAMKVLVDARPLSAEILAAIPRGATLAWAGHFDLGLLLSEGRKSAKKLDEFAAQEFENRLEAFREAIGFDLQKDLADSIGDEWAAYTDPATGGDGIFGLVLVNRLRDPAKAEGALGKLEDSLNKLLGEKAGRGGPKVSMRTAKVGDLTVHYLAVPGGAPAWAVRDGNLYVAAYPQSVVAGAAHVAGRGASIAQNPDFAALLKKVGQDRPTAVRFLDLPRVTRASYADLLMMARSALGPLDMLGADSPALAVPPLDKLLAHLAPAGGASWVDADGWHSKMLSPFPGSELLALGGLGPVVAGGGAAMSWGTVGPIASARAVAGQDRSATNLRVIGQAIALYADQNGGKLPTNLGELVMTQDLPAETFLVPGGHGVAPLVADKETVAAWVTRSGEYVYVGAGKKLAADPSAVVAHEPLGAEGRGVTVLFADGHVELLPAARVRELLAAKPAGL